MSQSIISGHLVTSYRRTRYQIGTGFDSMDLQIDQYSEPLAKFLMASRQSCAAIISAYNPFSQLTDNEKNMAAHEMLRDFLKNHAHAMIEGLNTDPSGIWPAEKSFFVPGLDLDTSRSLGQQFSQNAIVWIDHDAIPRLILLPENSV